MRLLKNSVDISLTRDLYGYNRKIQIYRKNKKQPIRRTGCFCLLYGFGRQITAVFRFAGVHLFKLLINIQEQYDDDYGEPEQRGHPAQHGIDCADCRIGLNGKVSIVAGSCKCACEKFCGKRFTELGGEIIRRAYHAVIAAALTPLHKVGEVVAVGVEHDEGDGPAHSHGERVDVDVDHGIGIDDEGDLADHLHQRTQKHRLLAADLPVDPGRQQRQRDGDDQVDRQDGRGLARGAQDVGRVVVDVVHHKCRGYSVADDVEHIEDPGLAAEKHFIRRHERQLFVVIRGLLDALLGGEVVPEAADDADYTHQYKKDFGPVYYAFQLSDAYYVVLNNMYYTGNKHYRVTLDKMPDQMHWLEQLLNSALNMGNRIYICMHSPLKFSSESNLIGGGQHLKDMLDNKFEGVILTGHMHHNNNFDIGGGIMEHNLGALCGNWWTNECSSDGAPCGYQVFEGKGREYPTWYYKATGHPKDYQFRLYQPGRVMDRPYAVVAKIWNWDEAWRVRWYQDGQLMGDMEQFYSFDPDYCEYVNGARVWDDYVPFRNNHFFSTAKVTGKHEIKVEVTDRAGRVYTSTIQIDVPEDK